MSIIDQVENFASEHKVATGLCLVGLAAVGGAAALRSLRAADELMVAEAGTPEFETMMRNSQLADQSVSRALQWKFRIGDPEVFATPSKLRGSSSWSVTLPDQIHSSTVEEGAFGGNKTLVQKYGDITVRQTPGMFEVEKPDYGRVVLNRNSSTGAFYGPDGSLSMRLDPSGTEIHYGGEGLKPVAAVRNMHRTLDFMGIFKT